MKQGKRQLLIDIMNGRNSEITSKTVITQDTLKLIEHETKRVGRPRYNWYVSAIDKYWDNIKTEYKREHRFAPFDIGNEVQCKIMIQAADKHGAYNKNKYQSYNAAHTVQIQYTQQACTHSSIYSHLYIHTTTHIY